MLNMVVCWGGGVGALMVCRALTAFAFGRISGRDWTVFIVLLLLRWGMVPISNSGLILGVGDSFKRCLSRIIRYCQ